MSKSFLQLAKYSNDSRNFINGVTLNCEVTTRKIGVLSCACVSLFVCVCVCVCVHTSEWMSLSVYVPVCVPVYVCHFVYVGTYVCVCFCVYATLHMWACTHPCVCSPHIMFMFSHRKAELCQPLSFASPSQTVSQC